MKSQNVTILESVPEAGGGPFPPEVLRTEVLAHALEEVRCRISRAKTAMGEFEQVLLAAQEEERILTQLLALRKGELLIGDKTLPESQGLVVVSPGVPRVSNPVVNAVVAILEEVK